MKILEEMNEPYRKSIGTILEQLDSLDTDTKRLVRELFKVAFDHTSLFVPMDTQIKHTKVANMRFIKEILLRRRMVSDALGTHHRKMKLIIENNRLAKIKNDNLTKADFSKICLLISQISPFQLIFNTKTVNVQ